MRMCPGGNLTLDGLNWNNANTGIIEATSRRHGHLGPVVDEQRHL